MLRQWTALSGRWVELEGTALQDDIVGRVTNRDGEVVLARVLKKLIADEYHTPHRLLERVAEARLGKLGQYVNQPPRNEVEGLREELHLFLRAPVRLAVGA